VTADAVGDLAEAVEIAIGSLRVSGVTAGVLDLSQLSQVSGVPVSAVLGRELFNLTLVDLDLPGGRVQFLSPEAGRDMPGAQSIPLDQTASGSPRVSIRLGDRDPIDAVLDLGSNVRIPTMPPTDSEMIAPIIPR